MIESIELIQNIPPKVIEIKRFPKQVNEIKGFPKKVNLYIELIDLIESFE